MKLTEAEQEITYTLFDDIQADAVAGMNTDDKEKAKQMLESIIIMCSQLQKVIQ